ncbi:MAG: hypothetical protein RQ826_12660 [Xanthomonadales bacterium]|nr:hypothetical protein [Xanthomonadales bacterium]
MIQVQYFDAVTTFSIDERPRATVLTVEALPPADDFEEVLAGWVSVLLTLKAACDHGIDLRNHDREASWDQGYVENQAARREPLQERKGRAATGRRGLLPVQVLDATDFFRRCGR